MLFLNSLVMLKVIAGKDSAAPPLGVVIVIREVFKCQKQICETRRSRDRLYIDGRFFFIWQQTRDYE